MIPSSHSIYLADLSDDASTQLKLQTSTPTLHLQLLSRSRTSQRPRNTKTTTLTLPSNPNNQPTLSSTQYPKREFSWFRLHSQPPTSPRFKFLMYAQPTVVSRARLFDQSPPWSRHARNRRRYRRRPFPEKPGEGNLVSHWNTFGWVTEREEGSVDDPTGLRFLRAEKKKRRRQSLDSSLRFITSNSWSLLNQSSRRDVLLTPLDGGVKVHVPR